MQVDLPGITLEVGRDNNGDPCITEGKITNQTLLDGWIWNTEAFQRALAKAEKEARNA